MTQITDNMIRELAVKHKIWPRPGDMFPSTMEMHSRVLNFSYDLLNQKHWINFTNEMNKDVV